MPITTHTTALSTSAIPTVMLPITTVPPVNTALPITTAPHVNPPIVPVPLPQWQSPTAPRFDPQNPSTLCTYLSDYESLAGAAQLTLAECLAQSTRYLTKEDKDDWENLPEFTDTFPDWDMFKQALFREYPNARKPFISSADLGKFVDKKCQHEIHTLDEFALFHQEFRRLANRLTKEKRVSADGLNRAYEKSIHPELQDKSCSIYWTKRHLGIKGEASAVEYVREGAEHILEGFDHRYKTSQPSMTPRTSSAPPISAPPVKSEMLEVLNAIAMMGQNLQKVMTASQSNSCPGPQGYAHQPAGFPSSQRMDRPRPGAAGNSCFMCNETAHFLNYCPVLLEYIQLGKASRNTQNNMVMLGNGDPIPFNPANRPWAARIDEYYARNPHLLPLEAVQANFLANLLEFRGQGTLMQEHSSPFSHLESINEDNETLGSLGGKENPEEAELGRYIEVLQARKKEMASGKKETDLPNPVLPEMDQLKEVFSAEKMYQAPPFKPLQNTPMPPIHAPTPQFRFVAPIESKVNVSSIINWVLSEKVYLSVEELLALAPEVRRHFKESMTTKKLPALPTEAQAAAAHTVSTFSMGMEHERLAAKPALPLQTIEVTLNGIIMVTGIIDSDCQVVIIRSDVWEKLGTPMKHEQVMFMESANGQANMTMGMIPSICFSVGEVSLYCSFQVVRNAPFKCLLGLPFMSLASTKSQEFPDGSAHLLFTDPNTGASITVPTHAKKSPRPCHSPCSHKEDF